MSLHPAVHNAATCGTHSGYTIHYRNRETPCQPCKAARRDYSRRQRATKRSKKLLEDGVTLAKLDEEKATDEPETGLARDIPRMWDELDDIPADIREVLTARGTRIYREYSGGPWTVKYIDGAGPVNRANLHGPYTEILGGAL